MPILDFSIDGVPYRSGPDIVLVILSVVGFPNANDEQRRLAWLRRAMNSRTSDQLRAYFPPGAGLPAPPAVHHRVLEAAKGPHFDRDKDSPEFGINTLAAKAAAFILVRTLASAPSGGSVNDAIHSYITGDGQRASVPGGGKETLKRAWRKYRPAAHLAALFFPQHHALLRDDPRDWLEWAEGLRIAGEQYRPPRAREPLLDAKVTWKAPVSLGLRKVPREDLGLPLDPRAITFDP